VSLATNNYQFFVVLYDAQPMNVTFFN